MQLNIHTGGTKRALRRARKPLLGAVIAGAALCSPLMANAVAATPSPGGLKPGELYGSSLTGPVFGMNRQGGCNEINAITDPTFGQVIAIDVSDADHNQPGRNVGTYSNGTAFPRGGCYIVHHNGGVSAGLSGPSTLQLYHEYFIGFGYDIPSAQPGLSSRVFPSRLPGFFQIFETLGGTPAGSPPTIIGLAADANTGQTTLSYGNHGKPESLWETTPFTFDRMHNIVIDYIPSPCATPTASCPVAGKVSVTDNGVALRTNFGAGGTVSTLATEQGTTTGAAQFPFLFQYRSTGNGTYGTGPGSWGGTSRTLTTGIKVGTTLASVQ